MKFNTRLNLSLLAMLGYLSLNLSNPNRFRNYNQTKKPFISSLDRAKKKHKRKISEQSRRINRAA